MTQRYGRRHYQGTCKIVPDSVTANTRRRDRTKTPVRVKHKLVVKAYFAVAGETLSGEPIQGESPGVGDLRMLVVNLPVPLPSVGAVVSQLSRRFADGSGLQCCCVAEWVQLPGCE